MRPPQSVHDELELFTVSCEIDISTCTCEGEGVPITPRSRVIPAESACYLPKLMSASMSTLGDLSDQPGHNAITPVYRVPRTADANA